MLPAFKLEAGVPEVIATLHELDRLLTAPKHFQEM